MIKLDPYIIIYDIVFHWVLVCLYVCIYSLYVRHIFCGDASFDFLLQACQSLHMNIKHSIHLQSCQGIKIHECQAVVAWYKRDA